MKLVAPDRSRGSLKLRKLEAVRGFAAIYVVLHHTIPHSIPLAGVDLGNLFRFGQEAVILFFLVSGFVIAHSYEQSTDRSFRSYLLRRFSRIYFPLLIVMLLGWCIECYRMGEFANFRSKELVLNLLMLQDLSALKPNTIVEPYMHNTPLWSLSYEWWFYMLFLPLTVWTKRERNANTLIFCCTIIAALAYVFSPQFVSREVTYLSIWWTGVYLARIKIIKSKILYSDIRLPICALLMTCTILAVSTFVSAGRVAAVQPGVHPFLEFRHFAFALVVVLLAVAWQRANWIGFDKLLGPFATFAPISYVIYISHQYFIVDATYLRSLDNVFLEWVGYFVALLVFAYVVEIVVFPKLQRAWLRLTMPSRPCKHN